MRLRAPHRRFAPMIAAGLALLAALVPAAAQFGIGDLTGLPAPKTETAAEDRPAVIVSAIPQQTLIRPGDRFAIAVILDHAPTWHTYPAAEQNALPPDMQFVINTEIAIPERPEWLGAIGPIQWPTPEPALTADPMGGPPITLPLFKDKAVAYLPIIVADDAPEGPLSLSLRVSYQACDDSQCLFPVDEDLTLDFRATSSLDASAPVTDEATVALFRDFDAAIFADPASWPDPDARAVGGRAGAAQADLITFDVFGLTFTINTRGAIGLTLLLLVAALGGFLLNLTPCVMPVIPIKILGLSQAAGNPARCFFLGLVMSAGVVAFFMAIGLAISFLAGFTSISSLFQTDWFSILVGLVIFVLALGMLGLFTTGLPQWVYRITPKHDSAGGSFLWGILTAILSTPCTAPFMGAAAAWATTQQPVITLATFFAIGFGMALPYLILSANPKWVDRIPRTGPASELVKQSMGLLLVAVAVFFLGSGLDPHIRRPIDPPTQLHWYLIGVIGVLAGLWVIYRTWKITAKPAKRIIFGGTGLFMGAMALFVAALFTRQPPIQWVPYTPENFAIAQRSGDVILLDFTAEWCLNCKALEKGVLYRPDVVEAIRASGAIPMKVDLTGNNADGRAKLNEMGRVAIPLLAIFGPGLEQPFLSDSYLPEQVREAVAQAAGRATAASRVPLSPTAAQADEPPVPIADRAAPEG